MNRIQGIIENLGYSNSPNLCYIDNIDNRFSLHTNKILKELQPVAVYSINEKPFVLFYNQINDSNRIKEINKKIWNAQIPVVIFCEENCIKVYNGSSMNFREISLQLICEESVPVCNKNSPFSYWSITSPSFWIDYENKYAAKKLNELLLENIKFITGYLKTLGINYATKMVLRIIFIRYLVDRGVDLDYGKFSNDVVVSQNELLEIVQEKESIYSLFAHLKRKFNGNLFDLADEPNDQKLTNEVFGVIHKFLSGKEFLATGQMSLFPLYDFNIIPVELISNIYEILLGEEARQSDSAFYTPSYLVDYILNESVSPYLVNHNKFRVLDPACGSGIFLVECFRRIVEKNLSLNGYFESDSELQTLLTQNIYGVDVNENAIDVAIFSLYLTILDYKDPKTLVSFKLPNLKNTNLIVADFFDDSKVTTLRSLSFDFIIGNPPWGNIKSGKHMEYCKQNNYPQYNSEISRSFVYKVQEFCNPVTQCCLVLPSKLLYTNKKPCQRFRELILASFSINKIIELSSVRKLVFKNADAPATIMLFKCKSEEPKKNRITHVALKPNIFFKLFNIIVIEKNDVKYVSQEFLLGHDWAWKTLVYGSAWDLKIINNLKSKFPTINDFVNSQLPKLITGAGVEYNDGEKLPADHLIGKRLLDSNKGIEHFVIKSEESIEFGKSKIHRPRNPELFQPPYCLNTTGVNIYNFKMRAAYSEDEFVYRKTMYAIKGSLSQKNVLLNLTGLLNSSFYAYLNLMLGSSIGIEREQRISEEVLEFPYAYSELIPSKVENIQALMKQEPEYGSKVAVQQEVTELDEIILDLFELTDNPFLDYAINIQIPQITGSQTNYRVVSARELMEYSSCFQDFFQTVYCREGKYVQVILYPNIFGRLAVFELIICDFEPTDKIVVSHDLHSEKKLLGRLAVSKINELFYQSNDVIYFDQNSFFILKTNEYKNWHPAIAQIDLSEIIDELLSENGGIQ